MFSIEIRAPVLTELPKRFGRLAAFPLPGQREHSRPARWERTGPKRLPSGLLCIGQASDPNDTRTGAWPRRPLARARTSREAHYARSAPGSNPASCRRFPVSCDEESRQRDARPVSRQILRYYSRSPEAAGRGFRRGRRGVTNPTETRHPSPGGSLSA